MLAGDLHLGARRAVRRALSIARGRADGAKVPPHGLVRCHLGEGREALAGVDVAASSHEGERLALRAPVLGKRFDPDHRLSMLQKISDMRGEANAMGASLFLGEYGGNPSQPGITAYMTAAYDGAGAVGASTMYWAYHKGDDGYGLLRADGSEKKERADVLTRPYPPCVAGSCLV